MVLLLVLVLVLLVVLVLLLMLWSTVLRVLLALMVWRVLSLLLLRGVGAAGRLVLAFVKRLVAVHHVQDRHTSRPVFQRLQGRSAAAIVVERPARARGCVWQH